MSKVIAVYPGSFDPITLGHVDIIKRSTKFVDKLIIGIGHNSTKANYLFSPEERRNLINISVAEELTLEEKSKVEVKIYQGLLMNFVEQESAKIIIRGLRALSDFDFEFNLAGGNQVLNSLIETVFLMTSINRQFISSKLVKEICAFGGDIKSFVPSSIITAVQSKCVNNVNNVCK